MRERSGGKKREGEIEKEGTREREGERKKRKLRACSARVRERGSAKEREVVDSISYARFPAAVLCSPFRAGRTESRDVMLCDNTAGASLWVEVERVTCDVRLPYLPTFR